MEEALTHFLLEDLGVASLVGDRISWVTLPQGQALPAVVLTLISRNTEYSVDLTENKLTMSRVQVDAWGLLFADAKLLGRAIFARLSAAQVIIDGIDFQAMFADREQDMFEQGTGNRDLWRNSQDFLIWHAAT